MGNQVNRRAFLQTSAILGASTAGASALAPNVLRAAEASAVNSKTISPKMLLKNTAALSKPLLAPSQLSYRLGLARTRTAAYPMDRMDFIMIDLERPDKCSRHATWCNGDLTGRLLEFLSCAEGVDGKNDPQLDALFERILKQRRPSGIIGRSPMVPDNDPLQNPCANRLSSGLMRYYELTGDARALEASVGFGNRLWDVRDGWRNTMKATQGRMIYSWISEFFVQLYAATKDPRWMEMFRIIYDGTGICDQNCHAGGFLSMLRGFQQMAMLTGDMVWNENVEKNRRWIIDHRYELPDGCTTETFPPNSRNEGCSIADWLILNLNAGMLGASDGYEKAEHTFWNAFAFNQWVTGGFGHRPLTGNGYGVVGMEEAWWCCVEDAGMAMSEYARHAVTFRNGAVHVNLLTPGIYEVPLPGGKTTKVKVITAWPSRAEATIEAENLPAEIPLKVRVPSCVRKPEIKESRSDGKMQVTFRGEQGHHIKQCDPGILLMYGPLVLVPATGCSQPASLPNQMDNGVPAGYVPKMMPKGVPAIKLPQKPDTDGFVKLPLCPGDKPLPEWSYFDEGPGSPTWVEGAPVEVQLKFPNGNLSNARFTPMCYNTSALVLFDTPVVFQDIE